MQKIVAECQRFQHKNRGMSMKPDFGPSGYGKPLNEAAF